MKSLEELAKIREESQELVGLRENRDGIKIVVGMGTTGIAAGARDTVLAFISELAKYNVRDVVITQDAGLEPAQHEPLVEVLIPQKPKVVYGKVDAERAKKIVADHIVQGKLVKEALISAS
jgi:NADP-reducing hydrogenase subunit HndB